ncbi:unnamed protein product [Mytilus edulis]|uniref:PHD-type domain-containing protein n=1 Tax=Mytilus edulis TaxID=6550 RepID=A0A8S3RKS6_MYTED|nr:unnamed protein product [Mytilus edulis]
MGDCNSRTANLIDYIELDETDYHQNLRASKYNLESGSREKFVEAVQDSKLLIDQFLLEVNNPEMDINNLSENLSNIILDSANKTFNFRPFKGKRKKKKGKQKWFNGNCKFFKRELNNLGSRLQQHPNNHDLKTSYHQLRREYKKLLKDTKKKFITDIIDKLDSLHEDNPKLFWKTINNLKKNTNREENPIPLSEMSNYLKKLYEENNTDLDISKIEIENINNKHLDYAFICKEVRDGIKKLKKNKQPGIDLIYNEFLLYGKDLLLLPINNHHFLSNVNIIIVMKKHMYILLLTVILLSKDTFWFVNHIQNINIDHSDNNITEPRSKHINIPKLTIVFEGILLSTDISDNVTPSINILYRLLHVRNTHALDKNATKQPRRFLQILLLLSGIETNPGPSTSARYPCGICELEVEDIGQRAIACNGCDTWSHKSCLGMNSYTFNCYANSSAPWSCANCNTVNHSTISYDIPLSDCSSVGSTYSSVHEGSELLTPNKSSNKSNTNYQDTSTSSFGSPEATSSPKCTQNKRTYKPSLRILNINFQSIRKKGLNIEVLIDTTSPDIIIGTKTWLSDDIKTTEFFSNDLGDFNAPDISWESNSITGSKHYPLRVSQTYLDISQDMALEQMVKFPTRLQNTLDLILTSHPSFMIRCKPLPPIGLKSDHDIVLYDTNIQPNRVKPTRRKIFLWKKANMKAIKISLKNFGEQFCQSKDQTVEAMWKAIKTILEHLIEKHVPTKQTTNRHTHPWINTQTRRAMRRKQRAHSKAKRTNNPSDWEKYKRLKANTQKETRKAHRKYIQDVVSNDFRENPKRFYTYVKRKDIQMINSLEFKEAFS